MLEALTLPLEIQWLPRYLCGCGSGEPLRARTVHPIDGVLRLDCPECGKSYRLIGRQRLFDRGVEFDLREVGIGDP